MRNNSSGLSIKCHPKIHVNLMSRLYSFLFISAEFADESSSPKKGPPLQLVLKSEGSTNYGNEYSATLPLTPDSTREILSAINRS